MHETAEGVEGSGKEAWLVRCFLCKQENLSFDPYAHIKSQVGWCAPVISVQGRWRPEPVWGLQGRLVLPKSVSFRFSERDSVSKK